MYIYDLAPKVFLRRYFDVRNRLQSIPVPVYVYIDSTDIYLSFTDSNLMFETIVPNSQDSKVYLMNFTDVYNVLSRPRFPYAEDLKIMEVDDDLPDHVPIQEG